jgi:hypothetical protein
MDFGYVLKRAWEIIWKFKVLWIFGILAGCGQASGSSGSNSSYRVSNGNGNIPPRIEQFFNQLDSAQITLMVTIAIIVVLLLIIISILLGTVGRVGLINGTMKAEQGAERLTFGELWHDGLTYFWRVFGLNLLIGVIIFVAMLAIFIPGILLTIGTLGIFLACLLPIVCLLVPVMWAVSVITEQANVALVVENLGIFAALKRGWQVVKENAGNMIVMALILMLGVGLLGGFIIGLPLVVVLTPALIGIAANTADALRNGLIIAGLLFVAYLPVLLLLSGILRAYTSSAWTLTYIRLSTKPLQSEIEAPQTPEATDVQPAESA